MWEAIFFITCAGTILNSFKSTKSEDTRYVESFSQSRVAFEFIAGLINKIIHNSFPKPDILFLSKHISWSAHGSIIDIEPTMINTIAHLAINLNCPSTA